MSKTKFSRYNDGVISIYREKEKRSNFGAKENVSVLDDMDFIAKLTYEESSKREQDIEFAQQMGFSLSLKVHTRYLPEVDNKCKAVINGYLYDVSYVDKNRVEMWIYLEGVKKI
ncbi:MAG: phage head closure protein [Clostridia bacterium]|nr:phage head closure protein [Clostridia bacterium]